MNLQGMVGPSGSSNFLRTFVMVSLHSTSSGSTKKIVSIFQHCGAPAFQVPNARVVRHRELRKTNFTLDVVPAASVMTLRSSVPSRRMVKWVGGEERARAQQ